MSQKELVINNGRYSYHPRNSVCAKNWEKRSNIFLLCHSHISYSSFYHGFSSSCLTVPTRNHTFTIFTSPPLSLQPPLETHYMQVLPTMSGAFQTLCRIIPETATWDENYIHFVVKDTKVQFSDFLKVIQLVRGEAGQGHLSQEP